MLWFYHINFKHFKLKLKTMKHTYQKSTKANAILLSLVLFLIFSAMKTQAQELAAIQGKVSDAQTRENVMYASVALYDVKDSSLVGGVITDDKGKFEIKNVNTGDYYLQVSFTGYKASKEKITVANNNIHNIGQITLKKDMQDVEEVVVKGERMRAIEEVDKTTYTVNESIANASNSGLDLLQKIPSVQVDFQENISIEGNSNILILVNGMKRDKDFVGQLDPKQIDKIEVQNNPSIKYDGDVSGVINILLKKDRTPGVYARLEGEAPTSENIITNNTAKLDIGMDNFRFFASDRLHYEQFDITQTFYRRSFNENNDLIYDQTADGNGMWMHNSLHTGFDWFINDKNSLNFYANYRPRSGGFEVTSYTDMLENKESNAFLLSEAENKDKSASSQYSLYYKRNFDKKGREMAFEISYYNHLSSNENEYIEQYYAPDKVTKIGEVIERSELTRNNRNSMSIRLDYTHPFSENTKLEVGYKNYNQWIDNEFEKAVIENPAENFQYYELRNAAYASLLGKIDKFQWNIAARVENSHIDIDKQNSRDYTCFLPQVNLSYQLPKKQNLKLNYSRYVKRPGINELNPFVKYTDSLNLSRGNPNLDPFYWDQIRLTYSRSIGVNYISFTASYDHVKDYIQSITMVNENNISETYYENLGQGRELGLGTSMSLKPFKWWNVNPFFKVYHRKFNIDDEFNLLSDEKLSYQMSLSSVMTFWKDLNIIMYMNYRSPFIEPQMERQRSLLYIFAVEKAVLKNGKVGVYSYIPFTKEFTANKKITTGKNFYQESALLINPWPMFTVRFSYTFKSGKKIKKLEREKELENDGKNSMF